MGKASDSAKFTIKAADLAKNLEISSTKLYKIVDFFDSNSEDEWYLNENEHFIWQSKTQGTRIFSEEGAYAIALYLDKNENKTFWKKFREFLFRHQQTLRQSFVRQKVLNNSSSLLHRNNRHYLSRKDIVAILGTSYRRFSQAFKDVQKTETLVYDQDFAEIEGVNYYSLRAVEQLSNNLGNNLKSENRRAWCKEVGCTGSKTLKLLADDRDKIDRKIAKAKQHARARDKDRCQITGQKSTPAKPINMAVHHIYCSQAYPIAADRIDNLITLTEEVHREFHAWNGGSSNSCTIHDLIEFVSIRYPDRDRASMHLNGIKHKLAYLDN